MIPPIPRMSTCKRTQPMASQSTSAPVCKPTKVVLVQKSDVDLCGLMCRYHEVHLKDQRPGADVSWQQWEVWWDMAMSEEVGSGLWTGCETDMTLGGTAG